MNNNNNEKKVGKTGLRKALQIPTTERCQRRGSPAARPGRPGLCWPGTAPGFNLFLLKEKKNATESHRGTARVEGPGPAGLGPRALRGEGSGPGVPRPGSGRLLCPHRRLEGALAHRGDKTHRHWRSTGLRLGRLCPEGSGSGSGARQPRRHRGGHHPPVPAAGTPGRAQQGGGTPPLPPLSYCHPWGSTLISRPSSPIGEGLTRDRGTTERSCLMPRENSSFPSFASWDRATRGVLPRQRGLCSGPLPACPGARSCCCQQRGTERASCPSPSCPPAPAVLLGRWLLCPSFAPLVPKHPWPGPGSSPAPGAVAAAAGPGCGVPGLGGGRRRQLLPGSEGPSSDRRALREPDGPPGARPRHSPQRRCCKLSPQKPGVKALTPSLASKPWGGWGRGGRGTGPDSDWDRDRARRAGAGVRGLWDALGAEASEPLRPWETPESSPAPRG